VVFIKDFISSFVPSPMKGDIRREFGRKQEFFDMSHFYSEETYQKLREIGKTHGIDFKEGVYLQVTGAQYETPAEIAFYQKIGADLVGMSTVVEGIAGRHAGMEICAMSTVTNMASGITGSELNHDEVKIEGAKVSNKLGKTLLEYFSSEE
jgi:purine-nucleoside phosphorylase